MMTSSLSSYKLFNKLYPVSLLAQLKTRKVNGNLNVFTENISWSIYLEEGELIYATSSEQIFERLEIHLQRFNQEIPTFNEHTYKMMGLTEDENNPTFLPNSDYRAICWLVEQEYITSQQAGILIEGLAKDVLETFISLKEGNYKLNGNHSLNELPKFCHLDLELIVEYCQKQLSDRQNIKFQTLSNSSIEHQSDSAINREDKLEAINTNSDNNHYDLQSQPEPKQYTIACIDDSQAVLNSIKYFLDGNHFAVVMINDPVKALMKIIRSKPDLILLDVEMPNLNGYELCSLLRKNSRFKTTPIIMVTSRKGFFDKAKAKLVRSSAYLTKPFAREDLLELVSKHIHYS